MVHTRYFSAEDEAQIAYSHMKKELAKIYDHVPYESDPRAEDRFDDVIKSIHDFIRQFP